MFKLARHLKALVGDQMVDLKTLRPIVKRWHASALPIIRTKPFEESWIDFRKGWEKVRFALDVDVVVHALERAESSDMPEAASQYDQPQVRLLVGLCRELQRSHGDAPFFLSCRKAGAVLNVDHATAARWLYLLVVDGILAEVSKGSETSRRATRYRYIGD